jgi:hypothetical protein
MGLHSSVSVVSDYGVEALGLTPCRVENLSSRHSVQTGSRANQTFFPIVKDYSFLDGEADGA